MIASIISAPSSSNRAATVVDATMRLRRHVRLRISLTIQSKIGLGSSENGSRDVMLRKLKREVRDATWRGTRAGKVLDLVSLFGQLNRRLTLYLTRKSMKSIPDYLSLIVDLDLNIVRANRPLVLSIVDSWGMRGEGRVALTSFIP